MKLFLPECKISDEQSRFEIDIKGNFSSHFNEIFETFFGDFLEGEDFFLTPLPVQFRKGEKVYLWVDWSESETVKSNNFKQQFQLSIADRIFQSANEICRHTNEYSIEIIIAKKINPVWIEKISERLSRSFTVNLQFLE